MTRIRYFKRFVERRGEIVYFRLDQPTPRTTPRLAYYSETWNAWMALGLKESPSEMPAEYVEISENDLPAHCNSPKLNTIQFHPPRSENK